MTDKELERIKTAYHSGLKVQIYSCGHWYDYDSREWNGFSKMRQYRIVGDDYAQEVEKQIAELEERVQYELSINDQKQNEINLKYRELNDANEKVVYLACHLNKAIEIIEELINCLEAEDVDYSVIDPARDFLREVK